MMDEISVIKRPRLKDPYLIAAWPGMGEVAFKAAKYLVEKLKCQEFARMPERDFFYTTSSVVNKGILTIPELPQGKFYFWKNSSAGRDLIIFVSNAQPDLAKAQIYCEMIIDFAKSFKIKTAISFAAMPQPIDHTQQSAAWFTATTAELNNSLKNYNMKRLNDGQITGMNGLFLGLAKKGGIDGFCLLGEIPIYAIQIENPKASLAVLSALARILRIKIDLTTLISQGQIMEGQINKLFQYLKLGAPDGPIGEEEIEKIKKSLSQLTKLPVSMKEKIEGMFKEAGTDISKANELKSELDKWNVYNEYEDRFLDLFKKKQDRDKSN
ncbi:PAC2 family protein [Candidatus Omnitrophota bacterium]